MLKSPKKSQMNYITLWSPDPRNISITQTHTWSSESTVEEGAERLQKQANRGICCEVVSQKLQHKVLPTRLPNCELNRNANQYAKLEGKSPQNLDPTQRPKGKQMKLSWGDAVLSQEEHSNQLSNTKWPMPKTYLQAILYGLKGLKL